MFDRTVTFNTATNSLPECPEVLEFCRSERNAIHGFIGKAQCEVRGSHDRLEGRDLHRVRQHQMGRNDIVVMWIK